MIQIIAKQNRVMISNEQYYLGCCSLANFTQLYWYWCVSKISWCEFGTVLDLNVSTSCLVICFALFNFTECYYTCGWAYWPTIPPGCAVVREILLVGLFPIPRLMATFAQPTYTAYATCGRCDCCVQGHGFIKEIPYSSVCSVSLSIVQASA